MVELNRFDVDYLDEEGWLKHIPCDDGDYVLAEDALALQAEIEELEGFVKHDYISMKNWQEEKAELQTRVEKLTAALIEFSEDKRFLGNYSDETQTTITALKQEGE